MLRPPTPTSERILLYSAQGGGKTTAVLTCAALLHQMATASSTTPPTFHVMDTDNRYAKQSLGHEGISTAHLRIHRCRTWPDIQRACRVILCGDHATSTPPAAPDDWVILDRAGEAWRMVAHHYISSRYGKEPDEYFLEWQRAQDAQNKSTRGNPLLEAYSSVINPMWFGLINPLLNSDFHLVCCTAAVAVNTEGPRTDSPETRLLFWRGVKPEGQKDLPAKMDSILLLNQRRGGWDLSTDREILPRTYHDHAPLTNFASDYLIGTAGWRPQ